MAKAIEVRKPSVGMYARIQGYEGDKAVWNGLIVILVQERPDDEYYCYGVGNPYRFYIKAENLVRVESKTIWVEIPW